MREQLVPLLVSALVLTGCGGDSSNGPTGPQDANVGGTWTYNATNLSGTVSGISISCNIEGMTMSLTQTGATFSGSFGPSSLSCFAQGVAIDETLPGSVIVNGSVNGSNVQFDFETSDWRNTGTASGSSMSGTVLVRLDLGTEVVTLNGNWAAARSAAAAIRSNAVGSITERVESVLRSLPD